MGLFFSAWGLIFRHVLFLLHGVVLGMRLAFWVVGIAFGHEVGFLEWDFFSMDRFWAWGCFGIGLLYTWFFGRGFFGIWLFCNWIAFEHGVVFLARVYFWEWDCFLGTWFFLVMKLFWA
jgi:hypothetical protein